MNTIEIERDRYEELLHKEKHLELILSALSRVYGYADVSKLKDYLGIEEKTEEV